MRLINADAYMEKVRHEAKAMPQKQGKIFVTLSEWIMEKTPSIEPKRGEWISNSPFTGTCSECGADGNLKDNFCSNCGADMRKEIYNDSRNNI